MNYKKRERLIQFAVALSIILIFIIALCLLTANALADTPPEMNYMELMIQSCVDCNSEVGYWAESLRNDKIDQLGLGYQKVSWDDLYLLARLIWQEAGADGISQAWRIDVGTVVMNRVNSPEFPDTLYEVVHQSGQYSGASGIGSVRPTRECVEAALAALENRGDLPSSVIFQANFKQGSGVYRQYYLSPFGTTYFCVSSRPELYSA